MDIFLQQIINGLVVTKFKTPPFIATLVDGTGLIIYFEMAKWLLPELQ